MKTTVDLPENLLAEVRAVAERQGWTMRVVFEESSANSKPFRLAHTVVRGSEFPDMSFAEMLEATAPGPVLK